MSVLLRALTKQRLGMATTDVPVDTTVKYHILDCFDNPGFTLLNDTGKPHLSDKQF